MAIELKTAFAKPSNRGSQDKKPTAQIWLNFGYYINEGTEEERFVSLPMGIPLDTMDRVSTRSSNQDYAQFQAARNDLLDQFLSISKDLEPGESRVIRTEGELAIQIRRVEAEREEPKADETNPYARPKLFGIAA